MFTDLAGRLAGRYTVVSYDQRGHSRSKLDDEPEDMPVALHADDAAAILRAVGNEQVDRRSRSRSAWGSR
jgi:pimeloyl-ACP methyl ester carboxylesterase